MALQLDTSEALLRPSQLAVLVRAVRDAADHEEHRWIEWKSDLNLTSSHGLGHIAKTVIGLANRQPTAAAHWAGGYGYLLVGVESGTLAGVTPVDPEALVGQVRALVGDALRWTPEYIKVDGIDVLVVVVDPPRPGDPIHYLRKQLDRFQPGTIFVRHTGRTDPATPADLDMLQARLLDRMPGLQLTVMAQPANIETVPDILGAANRWKEQRRLELLAARYKPERKIRATPRGISKPVRASLSVGNEMIADDRTENEYAKQVVKYLDRAEKTFINRAVWQLYRHAPALLHVSATNATDLGYTGVRLIVHVPGDISGYSDDLLKIAEQGHEPRFPTPPTPLGTPRRADLLSNLANFGTSFVPPLVLPRFNSGPRYTVRDTGSVHIEYDEFNVRPGDTVTLDPVPLLIRERSGVALTAMWNATAADVRGRLTGEFELTITANTLGLSTIEQHIDDV